MKTQAIIMAAGQGTRMNHAELPKVLIEASGKPLVSHVLARLFEFGIPDPVIVIQYKANLVRERLGAQRFVEQGERIGTGAAVKAAATELGEFDGGLFLLYGDCPCLSADTLRSLASLLERDPEVAVVISTGQVHDPSERYGRIVRNGDGTVERIVEYKDATQQERALTEYNAGPYIVRSPWIWSAIERLEPSPVTGEYYLTDIVEFAIQDGMKVVALPLADQDEAQGVNTPEDLAAAEAILAKRKDLA